MKNKTNTQNFSPVQDLVDKAQDRVRKAGNDFERKITTQWEALGSRRANDLKGVIDVKGRIHDLPEQTPVIDTVIQHRDADRKAEEDSEDAWNKTTFAPKPVLGKAATSNMIEVKFVDETFSVPVHESHHLAEEQKVAS
jgi:hypothetical protein